MSLLQVKTNFQELLDGKENVEQVTQTEYVNRTIRFEEVEPIRVIFRKNKYLMNSHGCTQHVSVDMEIILNHQLSNITGIAETGHTQYLNSFLNNSETFNSKNVICITENEVEECGKLENLTKNEMSAT